jgi:hypothetical protein
VNHPELDPIHHGPIVDFVHDQKFVPSVSTGFRPGQPRLVPPHPHLCMKGRDAVSLLHAVDQWHRALHLRHALSATWQPSGIPAFTLADGDLFHPKVYSITELITQAELCAEGAALGHCVATYHTLCQAGDSSIWSLTVQDATGRIERLLTLQVRNWHREIVQARGRFNRPANLDEERILNQWHQAGGPKWRSGC